VPGPALVKAVESTETFTLVVPDEGVVPDVGFTFSHEPPVLVVGVAVKLTGPGVELTVIGCDAGAVVPMV
jgi:hypothetical protein